MGSLIAGRSSRPAAPHVHTDVPPLPQSGGHEPFQDLVERDRNLSNAHAGRIEHGIRDDSPWQRRQRTSMQKRRAHLRRRCIDSFDIPAAENSGLANTPVSTYRFRSRLVVHSWEVRLPV